MDIPYWLHHFTTNRRNRPEPNWRFPVVLYEVEAVVLARSLAHFQIGESGGGDHLLRKAAAAGRPAPYRALLRYFVAEEQEHARLLALLVQRFGGKCPRSHWTAACFRLVRRALGFEWELHILLGAEIVGAAYYGLLGTRCCDPVLRDVCRLILKDEAQHLAFHSSYFWSRPESGAAWRNRLRAAWFRAVLAIIARIAWLDHGSCLSGFEVTRTAFLAAVGRLADRHVAAFAGSCSPSTRRRAATAGPWVGRKGGRASAPEPSAGPH